jgi:spore maturation protein CgeB
MPSSRSSAPGREPAGAGKPGRPGFWDKARIPRFRHASPRILLFTSGYFLEREILGAASRLGWDARQLPIPAGKRLSGAFVEALLGQALAFAPDFAVSVNHLGLDRQGEVMSLLGRMALPLASWFVDSPRLILGDYPGQPSPWCQLFSFDRDTLAGLGEMGFAAPRYLPLATDTTLFAPGAPGRPGWAADVSFVGDSMQRPSKELERRLLRRPGAREAAALAAPGFAASPERAALAYMRQSAPALATLWDALPDVPARLDLEQCLTWEATRLYRLERVARLAPFAPLIAGDEGWRTILPAGTWRFTGPLDYYRDLPGFYASAKVNFNATSLQMKGAVNQRVFDAPACGGFLITDRREQMDDLFEPDTQSVSYEDPGEIEGLTRRYLKDEPARTQIARKARERVLGCHDYTHRLKEMLRTMRRRYAAG